MIVEVGDGLRNEDAEFLDGLQAFRLLVFGHGADVDGTDSLVLLQYLFWRLGEQRPELPL